MREQGVTFGVAVVHRGTVNSPTSRDSALRSFGLAFGRIPAVLAEQGSSGFEYYGRPDIVRFLATLDPRRIPWRRFTIS